VDDDAGKPHRNKDGTLTRAGAKAVIRQGSTITMIAAFDNDKVYTYTRIQDLPSDEQMAEFGRRNAEYLQKVRQEISRAS